MNVAVVCRAKAFTETRAKLGWWSNPVEGLDWTFYPVEDGQAVDKNALARNGHDLIVWEDWCWSTWEGTSAIPVYAVMVDSNTSHRRRKNYQNRAKEADVLLIDQDHLKHFNTLNKPVFRWQGCVNERLFVPRDKSVDLAYHVSKTPDRGELYDRLAAWRMDKPYSMTAGAGLTIDQYAQRLGAAKVVIHKRTHEQCRSHRFFDALAAGACLLAERGWSVPEDGFLSGVHYLEWSTPDELTALIDEVLISGRWLQIANAGRNFVLSHHTWTQRAREFINIVERVNVNA